MRGADAGGCQVGGRCVCPCGERRSQTLTSLCQNGRRRVPETSLRTRTFIVSDFCAVALRTREARHDFISSRIDREGKGGAGVQQCWSRGRWHSVSCGQDVYAHLLHLFLFNARILTKKTANDLSALKKSRIRISASSKSHLDCLKFTTAAAPLPRFLLSRLNSC